MNFAKNQPQYKRLGLKSTDSPLKKSSSVGSIIHGDPALKSDHYIDALQRFKRDYASTYLQERQKKRQKINNRYQMRRMFQYNRQSKIKMIEEQNVHKLQDIQRRSLQSHQYGLKRFAHDCGIPVNPITLQYQNNLRGKAQSERDVQNKLEKLVRAHHIQAHGNSGYNIINGKPSNYVQSLVPQNAQQQFHEKLNKYYDKFRIKPPSIYNDQQY